MELPGQFFNKSWHSFYFFVDYHELCDNVSMQILLNEILSLEFKHSQGVKAKWSFVPISLRSRNGMFEPLY